MKNILRAMPAFTVGAAVFYALAFRYNWPAVTYFPALDEWHWGFLPGSDDVGPPMHWYGWIIYAFLAGIGLGALSLLLPARWTEKAWNILAWAAPLAAMAYMIYIDRLFFL